MIENSGKVQTNFDVMSNTSGVVVSRRVNNGDHVAEGTILYDIADLSHVWVMFDAYESDLPFLNMGDKMNFTVQALPGIKLTGNISFIDPVLDPITRVAKVRIEINNESGRLKPEMFATGIVNANLIEYKNSIIIPQSAVLWTGKRSIVYVKQPGTDEPIFKIREIELGPMLGSSYVVENGLKDGEEIVTQGTFSVDAAAQLEGKPSMMDPAGGTTSSMPGMDMTGVAKSKSGTKKEPVGHSSAGKLSKLNVSMDFTMQLNTVFDQYIILKDAFVQSDIKKAKQATQKVQQALAKVDMKLLTGDVHMQWMNILGNLDSQLKALANAASIEDQRLAFAGFSNQFYMAIKSFGLMGKTAYYQFCPMANNKKGAYWLSESKIIRNPYFGEKMMDCGENKETLSYK
jgi:membrane fusion protein, copper/silver efflux system